jgi:hypothetical protein
MSLLCILLLLLLLWMALPQREAMMLMLCA